MKAKGSLLKGKTLAPGDRLQALSENIFLYLIRQIYQQIYPRN
jgi:hypothetical protein